MTSQFPLPDLDNALIRPFWDAAARHELRFPKRADGQFEWYPTDTDREWVQVFGPGQLYSWVTVHRALHPGYQALQPYVSALVTFEEAPGIRLVTRLLDAPENLTAQHLTLSAPVDIVFADAGFPNLETGLIAPLARLRA